MLEGTIKPTACICACPAGVDIPCYIRLISQGRFDEALSVIRHRIPFPSVCGRVCPHPCEEACQSTHLSESVAIKALKRFVSERVSTPRLPQIPQSSGKNVAVVGSGPAGLTAAYFLRKVGHGVVVLEALPAAGGMMRVGIPEYRLPKKVLDKEIADIKNIGVEIKTNVRVDSPHELLEQGYDAVFLALGAHRGTRLMVEGEDNSGVTDGITFLRNVNLGMRSGMGDKVAVIGGGNVAIDSARTALRLDAKDVTIIYRRTKAEMPASPEEVGSAFSEGVKFIFLAAPVRIGKENGELSLSCMRMELGQPDGSGRPRPTPIKGSEFIRKFDAIIVAIGEVVDIPKQFSLKIGKRNTINVDPSTLSTDRQGVFAGGDAVTGPASVIEAIAAGRRAAVSIDRYLGGGAGTAQAWVSSSEDMPRLSSGVPGGKRSPMSVLNLKERLSSFEEVELGFDEALAVHESKRCLWCDLPISVDPTKCVGCFRCALMCSIRFEMASNPYNAKIKIVPPDRSSKIGEAEISFTDDCDGCGICVSACAYGALTRGAAVENACEMDIEGDA